jgi:hypothetical protein
MRARGQTLLVLAMCLLVLTLMAMLTLSIASKVRDRIELQTIADASAYSNAIAAARSFNNSSLLNRAMISQWSAMCAVATLHAWGSSQNAYFYSLASTAVELNDPNNNCFWNNSNPAYDDGSWQGNCQDGNGYFACQCRWRYAHAINPPALEDCGSYRQRMLESELDTLTQAGDLAWGRGYAALDGQVIQQVTDLWQSMNDLGRIQLQTHQQLVNLVQQQTFASALSNAAGIKEPVTVAKGTGADNVALRELNASAPLPPNLPSGEVMPAPDPHMRAMVQAIMGTRGDPFYNKKSHPPFAFTDWMRRNNRDNGQQHFFPNGGWVRYSWPLLTRNQAHPGAYCQNAVCPYAQSVRSQPPTSGPAQQNNDPYDNNQMDELYTGGGGGPDQANTGLPQANPGPWRGPTLAAQMPGLYGGVWAGDLLVEYRDPNNAPNGQACPSNIRWNAGEAMSFVWYSAPSMNPRHYTTGHHPTVDEENGHHPGESSSLRHVIGNAQSSLTSSVLPFSVGFVFPALNNPMQGAEGSNGAWGQPKLPTLLKRTNMHQDPWNMLTGMRFQKSSAGTELDLQKGYKGPVALGNAIAYYHRTSTNNGQSAWAEAPSFLNPYWRATLVSLDVDQRPKGLTFGQDNTPVFNDTAPDDAPVILSSPLLGGPGSPEQKAYLELTKNGYKGGQ